MPQTILTPAMILRESYAIMHQVSNFVSKTNRQYDNRFQLNGYQLGQTINVRLPPKYTVRTGNVMSVQNLVERSVPLTRGTVKGVDLNFSQTELSLSMSDFSERVLKPALTQLASAVESDALSMYKDVANVSGSVTTSVNFRSWQNTGRFMTDQLAPVDNQRTMTMATEHRVDFSDAVKGLFQSSENIKDQYVDGMVGRTGGYSVFENTLMPSHVCGTFTGTPAITTSAAADTGYDGTGNAWTTSFVLKVDGLTAIAVKAGDVLTISGVYDVHPESKLPMPYLKRFVVADDYTGTTGTHSITIQPAPILSGAYQSVSAAIADGAAVTFMGITTATAAKTISQSLGFHKDAFAFVTADLEDPSQYGAWGARQVQDNMSMRIWRQGDIANGAFPCRIDICYGYAPIYPEWACRLVSTAVNETF